MKNGNQRMSIRNQMPVSSSASTSLIKVDKNSFASMKLLLSVIMIFVSFVTLLSYALFSGSLSVVIAYFLFGTVGLFFAIRFGRSSLHLFLIVYSINVLAAVVIYAIYLNRYGVPYFVGGSDDLAFETAARQVADTLEPYQYLATKEILAESLRNAAGYIYLNSLIYRVSGAVDGFDTMIPRLLNSMFAGLIAVTTYRIALHIRLSRKIAIWTGYIVGLLPVMVFTSSHSFRDVITSFLTLWIVFIWARALDKSEKISNLYLWGQTLLAVIILSQFRWYQSLATAVIALVAGVAAQIKLTRKSILIAFFAILAFIFMGYVLLLVQNRTIASSLDIIEETQQGYVNYRASLSDGLGAFVFTTPPPLTYILRIGYALIYPLPILHPDVERMWLSVGTIFRYLFIPFLIGGIFVSARTRQYWHILSAFLFLFVSVALITFTTRHIIQYLPYAVLLSALGYSQFRHYSKVIWLTIIWVGVIFALIYVAAKTFV